MSSENVAPKARKTVSIDIPVEEGMTPEQAKEKYLKTLERSESDQARRAKYNEARKAATSKLIEKHRDEYLGYLKVEKSKRNITIQS